MISITEFRERHRACASSLEWTRENCSSMQDVWDKAPACWLIWVATRPGVLTEEDGREFCLKCIELTPGYLNAEEFKQLVVNEELDQQPDISVQDKLDVARRFALYKGSFRVLMCCLHLLNSEELANWARLNLKPRFT